MSLNALRDRKKAQKENLMYQEISKIFLLITLDEERLKDLSVSKVTLSRDKSHATVYMYTPGGLADFEKKRPTLILYKASMRKAISQKIPGRYTPELTFVFDELFEKQQKIQNILEKVKSEEQS